MEIGDTVKFWDCEATVVGFGPYMGVYGIREPGVMVVWSPDVQLDDEGDRIQWLPMRAFPGQ